MCSDVILVLKVHAVERFWVFKDMKEETAKQSSGVECGTLIVRIALKYTLCARLGGAVMSTQVAWYTGLAHKGHCIDQSQLFSR